MPRFISIFFIIIYINIAGSVDLNLKRYTVKEGLVQSQVYTVTQSGDGYIWIGTAAGLSRFDGRHFKTFFRRDGLGGNVVKCSFVDKEGNVWFGHYSGKLSKYNWRTKNISIINLTRNETFRIRRITQDLSGHLWVATNTNGLYIHNKGGWLHFNEEYGLKSNFINILRALDNGYVVVGTDKGLLICRYNPKNSKLDFKDIPALKRLDNIFINDIDVEPSTQSIWIATESKGLFRLYVDSNNNKYRLIQYNAKRGLKFQNIKRIKVDKSKKLWIALQYKGILIADLKQSIDKLKYVHYLKDDLGINKRNIYCFFPDREGNMWIGSNGRGLFVYRNTNIRITAYNLQTPSTLVWSIAEYPVGEIWFGMEGTIGVAKLNNFGLGTIKYISSLKMGKIGRKQVLKIRKGIKGELFYISWRNGIFRLNSNTLVSEAYIPYKGFPQDKINDIVLDGNDRWFATKGKGIIRYNVKTGDSRIFNSFNNIKVDRFYLAYKDRKGNLWFGSYTNGIVKYDGKKFYLYNRQSGFPLKSVFSIAEDFKGNLWFVSYSGSLVKYNWKNFYDYSFAKGIDGQPVYSIVDDDSTLWVSTPSGIFNYNSKDSSFSNYFTNYGFRISETNTGAVFRDSEGNIWFGTVDGLVQLKPEKEKIPDLSLPIFIDKIQVYYKNVPIPKDHKYNYNRNYLTFHYRAVSMVNPERIRYSFILEGYDKNWSPPSSESKVTYFNLPPGKYTFKVKACDSYGRWVNKAVVYSFEIKAPFWRTWPFYLLSGFFLVFIVGFIYKRRVSFLEKYNRELEREVQKRIADLRNEKEKVEYAFNALRKSEKKFRIFTETTAATIFIIKNRKIVYINPAGEKMIGYSAEKLYRFELKDIIHQDSVHKVIPYLNESLILQDLINTEVKIVGKNKKNIWVDLIIKPIDYNDERVLLGTAVNITSRKVAEERLLEEKEKLSVTLSSITDAVVTTDIYGRIVLMNPIAEKISGYTFKNSIGKNINKIFYLKDEKNSELIIKLFQGIKDIPSAPPIDNEAIMFNDDGHKIFIEYTSSFIRDRKGKIKGVVFVIRDITERKKMIGELLKNRKLESLGVLAGGIAHDFNNILTAIIGNLSLAKIRINQASEAFKYLELSEKSTLRARDLTQQLLTFSKGGRPVKDNAPIDTLIEDTTSFILSGSNVVCNIHFADNLPHVVMDSGQISQVIQNLIINAKQAMPNGGSISIDVSSTEILKGVNNSLDEGLYVIIKITDEGKGIEEERLDKIFDPFYTTKKGGSGLGLSTSYSIVKNHNGSIEVESIVGKGTTFTIYLPAVVVHGKKEEEKRSTKINRTNAKVLIMDDEELVLETAASMFEFMGCAVERANTGEEAIRIYKEALNNEPFSLVIMDLTIRGGMSGRDAAKDILNIDPDAVIVVSSGYSNDPVMADFEKYGFKRRIQKPYNIKELSELLQSVGLS